MNKKEYGGYIEFETYHGTTFHDTAIALNCGRNCLAYLLKAKKIKKLYLPYFLCSSVEDTCKKMNVDFEYYHIDEHFFPCFRKKLALNEYLYIVNFYGQIDNELLSDMKSKYGNIIVDQSQSYFQMPIANVDTLYTCRKYFGVADGAFLYTDVLLEQDIPQDVSTERMHFLLGRYEGTASEYYNEYVANNKLFDSEPLKRMSKLTQNLLRGIDYQNVGERRRQNFAYLHEHLQEQNQLELKIPYGAFMYPLLIENGHIIRKELQKQKIYIPTLWPDVFNVCDRAEVEYKFAAEILPLPVDQRYDEKDMKYLVEVIKNVSAKRNTTEGFRGDKSLAE